MMRSKAPTSKQYSAGSPKTTGKTYANREDRDKRLRSERRAGLTAKQRERMGVPKKLVNFRASEETRALLKKMARTSVRIKPPSFSEQSIN